MMTSRQFAEGQMLADVEEGVGLITFNQPKKHNAMSVDMWEGLGDILDLFAGDQSVRAVVLSGAGHKAFVSGADIGQFDDASAQAEYEKAHNAGSAKLADFPKPVIARIRGFCLGGGLAIALQADLRIAAHDSEFGIRAARLGMAYGFDVVQKLVALVGPGHARRLLYTGQRINAEEAERIGLINKVVSDETLSDEVLELARTMADNAPLSLRAMKLAVNEAGRGDSVRDMAAVERAVAACFDSADYREGREAFREKRTPRFLGR